MSLDVLPSNAGFDVKLERRWRIRRIVALIVAAASRLFFGPEGPSFYPAHAIGLFYPTPENFALLLALAAQVRGLLKPAYARSNVLVFMPRNDDFRKDVVYVPAGVLLVWLCTAMSYTGSVGMLGMFFPLLSTLGVLLIVVRETVVIDGPAKTATRFFWLPRRASFGEVEGLGLLQEMNRGRAQAGFLALFVKGSEQPWRLIAVPPDALQTYATRIQRATGLVLAPQRQVTSRHP
ncbi:MAG: hypothetical protein AAF938_07575 [Myxococcota bacterium]